MASDRDTLAALLKESGNRRRGLHYNLAYWQDVADDLVAAGVRPPVRVITDPAEADALPIGSVALVPTGVTHTDVMPWTRSRSGWWAGGSVCTSEYLIRWRGPLTLIHVPTEEASRPNGATLRCGQCGVVAYAPASPDGRTVPIQPLAGWIVIPDKHVMRCPSCPTEEAGRG